MTSAVLLILSTWVLASSALNNPQPEPLLVVRRVSLVVNRPQQEVYDFISHAENYLPKWTVGRVFTRVNDDWLANTPLGKVTLHFAEQNQDGILDYDFTLESGQVIHNQMRVANYGGGSEITRTIVRPSDMADREFALEVQWAEKDLQTFKQMLER